MRIIQDSFAQSGRLQSFCFGVPVFYLLAALGSAWPVLPSKAAHLKALVAVVVFENRLGRL